MRILHIPHAYWPVLGGTEILCQRVGEALAAQGHHVRVVTSNLNSVEGFYRFDVGAVGPGVEAINGVEVVRLPYHNALYRRAAWLIHHAPTPKAQGYAIYGLRKILNTTFRWMLEAQISAFAPDVVMTMPHLVTNVQLVLEIQRRRKFPLVLVPLAHATHFEPKDARYQQALDQADAIIAATAYEGAQLKQVYAADGAKLFVGMPGIDIPPLDSAAPRQKAILFLGRLTPAKGILKLLATMELVWKAHADAVLILAGANTPETETIRQAISALPAAHQQKITVQTDVSEAQKRALLQGAWCLVLPSPNESFGIVLVEAMGHATPVIALDMPVFREIVVDEHDGLLVPPDDAAACAAAIVRLLDSPEESRRLGSNGHQSASQKFRWAHTAEAYLAAYNYAVRARSM